MAASSSLFKNQRAGRLMGYLTRATFTLSVTLCVMQTSRFSTTKSPCMHGPWCQLLSYLIHCGPRYSGNTWVFRLFFLGCISTHMHMQWYAYRSFLCVLTALSSPTPHSLFPFPASILSWSLLWSMAGHVIKGYRWKYLPSPDLGEPMLARNPFSSPWIQQVHELF